MVLAGRSPAAAASISASDEKAKNGKGGNERKAVWSSWRAGIPAGRVALLFVLDWKAGEGDLVSVSARSQLRTNAGLHRRSSPVLIVADVVRSYPLICPRLTSRCTTRHPFQSSRGPSSAGGDAAWHCSSVTVFDNVDNLLQVELDVYFFILPLRSLPSAPTLSSRPPIPHSPMMQANNACTIACRLLPRTTPHGGLRRTLLPRAVHRGHQDGAGPLINSHVLSEIVGVKPPNKDAR
ncbi:hypothetical protein FIBSPDRAFT_570867 [Athelia psychrophila]|uniref:Uncharacterized protein n=1 Tax=Athelia psychrophila TaxID=1759441 RepID=A0A166HS32_9AGAM|nr:hypothetical protein FIBSPDRAFT_570867 [Fibularhizoctonia sp. CBS 109695]